MRYGDEIIRLRNEGKKYREIQEILGCSKGTISHHLGNGQKEKARNRQTVSRHKNRTWMKDYKESRPCADCGEFYPAHVMDFDHLPDHDKSFGLANAHSHISSLSKIQEEVLKCDVVCANCHRVRTFNRKQHLRKS
jgi:hypothetical protein